MNSWRDMDIVVRTDTASTMLPQSPGWMCTTCRSALEKAPAAWQCRGCGRHVPVVDGITCFDATPPLDGGDAAAYQRFMLTRSRRAEPDAYAAFQPFNEAGRTWQAFYPLLQGLLRPGDVIVDLANRTGWTGAELAAAFPDQQVVSLWTGDHDLLGHRGFRFWYGNEHCPANLHLAFIADPAALPFATGAVQWVHGHDVLHHRDPEPFLREVVRVLADDGCALFPHVHTADVEPQPWFARGGTVRRASAYRDQLTRTLRPNQRGLVLGEATLFTAMGSGQAHRLAEAPFTDCNAVVAIVPEAWVGETLAGDLGLPDDLGNARVLMNPLLTIDAYDGSIGCAADAGALAGHLLPRHQVYARRLRARLPTRLEQDDRLLCYWAERLPTVAAIAAKLECEPPELRQRLAHLQHAEVLCVRRLDTATARLQRCHTAGVDLPTADADHPRLLWRRAVDCFPERPFLVAAGLDDDGLTYAQANEVVCAIARRMARAEVGPGTAVVVAVGLGVESLLFIWAAFLRSATVVVCDGADAPPEVHGLPIAAVFASSARWTFPNASLLSPEGAAPPGWTELAAWYDDDDLSGGDPTAEPTRSDVARSDTAGAVLFTSGSTGIPKGVRLSWSALARSARLLAGHYQWSEVDRLLSLGGLHTMSGLRNPVLAAVAVGAAVVVPAEGLASAVAVADLINRERVSVLGAGPATVQNLITAAARIANLAPLRVVLCTGSRLPIGVRQRFSQRFAVPVRNYYGLTETCGFCFGDALDGDDEAENSDDIGGPVDALVRIVDVQGHDVPRGESGELLIHSANLMLGYLGAAPRPTRDFWYRTGDLARIGASGRCTVIGRLREILKNGYGEIVSCRQIEDALLAIAGVADAVTLPITDRDGLEQSLAWVVAADPPEQPEAWLSALRRELLSCLGAQRMPTCIRLCTTIPRRSNGKLWADQLPAVETAS